MNLILFSLYMRMQVIGSQTCISFIRFIYLYFNCYPLYRFHLPPETSLLYNLTPPVPVRVPRPNSLPWYSDKLGLQD